MRISELATKIGAEVVTAGAAEAEVEQVYAGDRVSDLLTHAHGRVLLVSSLPAVQLMRVAELMDVPALCLVDGQRPDGPTRAAAERHGTAILVVPEGLAETSRRLRPWLPAGVAGQPCAGSS